MENWRIQYQILIPMTALFAIGISLATFFNIQGLIRNENKQISDQVEGLFNTISTKSFPLNRSVLAQVEQISGVHLMVRKGGIVESSFDELDPATRTDSFARLSDLAPERTTLQGQDYAIFFRRLPERNVELIAFYPLDRLFESIRGVVIPQIISGIVTLIVVGLVMFLVARNVTSPIQTLQNYVKRIAEGDFPEKETPKRTDEIGDLFRSISEMSSKLNAYQQKIRSQEKLLTLDQLGSGIAHQMRNSITGCRLALDLHQQSCSGDKESLEVATRQLTFMEDFQKRFLSFTKDSGRSKSALDLVLVVKDYAKLLKPFANHVHVQLRIILPDTPQLILGNEGMIQQLVGNLTTNAIEAASTNVAEKTKEVIIEVKEGPSPTLVVRDTGTGIPDEVKEKIYEPLVTTKADGVGLGLAIVWQTVHDHNASIESYRDQSMTRFEVRFPSFTPADRTSQNPA